MNPWFAGIVAFWLVSLAIILVSVHRVDRRRQRLWSIVAQGTFDALWYTVPERNLFYQSEKIRAWAGLADSSNPRWIENWREFVSSCDRDRVADELAQFVKGDDEVFEVDFQPLESLPAPRWLRVRAYRKKSRSITEWAGTLVDISEERLMKERLRVADFCDPVTGLPNRRHLLEFLAKLSGSASVLMVDVDHFSEVISTHGHSGGDQILNTVGQTLKSLFRSDDLVGRWDGDRFAVIAQTPLESANKLASRIHTSLKETSSEMPFHWNLTVSVGIVFSSLPAVDPSLVLNAAEQALHRARTRGGARTEIFNPAIGEEMKRKALMENRLGEAFKNHSLRIVFQPQYRLDDTRLLGFEALARWSDAELGDVAPSEFIPIAESKGLIGQFGYWALEEACRFLASQGTKPDSSVTVAVNISVLHLQETHFVETCVSVVNRYGVAHRQIELEVTETTLASRFEDTILKLVQLRNNGFRIALDDFGKGYSSLSYLKVMPLDTLKIDKVFLDEKTNEALLGAIIDLGANLGLQVLAEGIERSDQLALLTESGCHRGQGFLFSPPLEWTDAAELLAAERQSR